MRIYIYTYYICIYIHTVYKPVYVYVYIVCVYIYICAYTYIHIIYAYIYTYTVYKPVYVYVNIVCIYIINIHIYIYTYIHIYTQILFFPCTYFASPWGKPPSTQNTPATSPLSIAPDVKFHGLRIVVLNLGCVPAWGNQISNMVDFRWIYSGYRWSIHVYIYIYDYIWINIVSDILSMSDMMTY